MVQGLWLFSRHFTLSVFENGSLAFWGKRLHSLRKTEIYNFFFPSCSRFSKSAAAFSALNTEFCSSLRGNGQVERNSKPHSTLYTVQRLSQPRWFPLPSSRGVWLPLQSKEGLHALCTPTSFIMLFLFQKRSLGCYWSVMETGAQTVGEKREQRRKSRC